MKSPVRAPAWADRVVVVVGRNRHAIVLLVIGFAVLAALQARELKVDNSLTAWFAEDSTQLADYRRFLASFGSDDLIAVLLERESGFADRRGIRILRESVQAMAEIPGVDNTFSLLNLVDTVDRAPSYMALTTLSGLDRADERLDLLRSDPLIGNRLLSADGKSALVLLRMHVPDDIDLQRDDFSENLSRALAPFQLRHASAGLSIIYAELNKLSRSESPRLLALAVVSMCVVLLLSLRQIVPLAIALVSVSLAVILVFGFIGFTGGSINLLTSIVPTVLLVIGVSIGVHIFLHLQTREHDPHDSDRVPAGIAFMLKPCGLAALTTFVGFASLTLADLAMTRELGILLALGVAAVFLLVILNSIVAGKCVRTRPSQRALLAKVATRLARFGADRPRSMVGVFSLLAVFAGAGALQVEIDAFPLELLPPEHPIRLDASRIEDRIGPFTALEFVVSASDDVLQLHHLQEIDRWAETVVDDGYAAWSGSILDGIKRIYQLRHAGYPAEQFQLPEDPEELQRIVSRQRQLAARELSRWTNLPHQIRYVFAVKAQSSANLQRNLEQILALAPRDGLTVEPAGLMPLWLSQVSALVKSQVRSFSLALVVVVLIIALSLRQIDLVTIAIVVNLLPVLFTLGLMGAAGIRLDLGTVAVASVILGLVVDDTIHFMYRLKHELRNAGGLSAAIHATAGSTGHAILLSSMVICLGFGVLGFAEVTSVAWFGLLIAAASASALLSDILLAPAMLTLWRERSAAADG